jgi:phosphoribosylanthranilate isomerase
MDRVTKVKICGITNRDDAELAVEHGAWAIGLIFADSPRRIEPAEAEVIGNAHHRKVEVAGVFVNAPLDEVAAMADLAQLTLVQLHGDEGPAYAREVERRTGARVIKAIPARDPAAVRRLGAFHTDYHLLDAYVPGERGGTGKTFQWDYARHHPRGVPLILSGGLTADNVAEAIRATQPFAVDTASGTEDVPGIKDPAKVKAFFRAVQHADEAAAA